MDLDKIIKLLDIIDGTRVLPKLKAIHDVAELELVDMVENAQKLLDKRKQDAKDAEEKAAAKVAAEKPKAVPSSSYPYTGSEAERRA